MLKTTIALGFVAAMLSIAPAMAADAMMACTDADMAKMQMGVDKMAAADKDAATKEMMMAKDAMGKKDDKGCMDHMGKVQMMMPKQ